jgi:MFS family permease
MTAVATPAKTTPAWVFMPLVAPFGISSGYVSVTLAYILTHAGLGAGAVTGLVALSLAPQAWKFFWAPLIDTTLTPAAWCVIGSVAVGLGVLGMSLVPDTAKTLPLLSVLVVVCSVASTAVSMSVEIFMAEGVEDVRKGAASGWNQAGNLGGSGLGGGLALWLAQHAPAAWVSGAAIFGVCALCPLALLLVRTETPPAQRPNLVASLREVGVSLWGLARSRLGVLAFVLMLLPIGSGAAVWATVAPEWKVDGDTVALVNGLLGGLATIVGAVAAGFVCDLLDRKTAYCAFGLLMGAVAAGMYLGPRTREAFIVATLAYACVMGACYAAYGAVVLEAIGKGAAATKFNLLSSVSNVPIVLMTTADGALYEKFGAKGMLIYAEAGFPLVSVILFALFAELTRNRRRPRAYALRLKSASGG